MRTMQAKIMERVEKMAEDLGLEVAYASDWANRGHVIFTKKTQFEPLCDLFYDVQSSYASFTWRTDGKPVRGESREDGQRYKYVEFARSGSMDEFLNQLLTSLMDAVKVAS